MNLTLHLSQLNSFVSDLFDNIGNFFGNTFSIIGYSLIQLFYRIIICSLFAILDAVQLLFRKLAGLDTYYVNGEATDGDIVLTLINNQTVQNVFWSLVILAAVLLVIVTIVALIKQETLANDDKNRKSRSKIFSSALRALFNFFMVPIVAILGIFMGNALLKSLDGATNQGSITRASVMIFNACSQDANRARISETFRDDLYGTNGKDGINNMGVISASTKDGIANAIDMAFTQSATFTSQKFDFDGLNGYTGSRFSTSGYYKYVLSINNDNDLSSFSIYNPDQVFYYYDLSHFNFLLAIISLVLIVWILLEASIGLIKRMFELVILLCISPVVCSVMPLDEGPIKEWKKTFIQNVLLAYSVIVSLNLMMMLFGPLQTITLFGANDGSALSTIGGLGLNSFLQLLITCSGFMFFKNFSKDLAGLLGIKEDMFGVTKDKLKTMAGGIGKGLGLATGVAGAVTNKAIGLAGRLDTKYRNAKKEMHQAGENLIADPKNEDKKKALDEATKKFNDIRKRKVTNYEEQAKTRLNQAKSIANGFVFNGIDKPFKDNFGGKMVSPKAFTKGTVDGAIGAFNSVRRPTVFFAKKHTERKINKQNQKTVGLGVTNEQLANRTLKTYKNTTQEKQAKKFANKLSRAKPSSTSNIQQREIEEVKEKNTLNQKNENGENR